MKKTDDREQVLTAIRTALARQPAEAALPRKTQHYTDGTKEFLERLQASPASLDRAKSLSDVPQLVAAWCKSRKLANKIAVAEKLAKLDWQQAGLTTKKKWDDKLSLAVTGCSGALAETGQFLVTNDSDEAWLSLVAPIHVVVIQASALQASLDDLPTIAGRQIPSVMTLVHGASRTGDIEQTLVMGAHGPREVHAIFVDEKSSARD